MSDPIDNTNTTPAMFSALEELISAAEVDANVDRVTRAGRMAPLRFLGKRGSRFVVIP